LGFLPLSTLAMWHGRVLVLKSSIVVSRDLFGRRMGKKN
jgi:hypothetical protein